MPEPQRLHERFVYSIIEGALYWREPPANNVDITKPAGSISSSGYHQIMVDKVMYKRHRLVWCYHFGDPGPKEVDHINRVRGDDRIENLRLATRAENNWNRSTPSNNSSGFMGVTWNRKLGKWIAVLGTRQGSSHIGVYEKFEDAVAARVAAEFKIFGQFAPSALNS